MSYSSSYLLLIPAPGPATGWLNEYHRLKCRPVELDSYRYAGSFGFKSKSISVSNSRRLFRCNSQLEELAPATSAAYGLLLLGGGLFAYTKSGSKGSLFGGFTGAALMASAYFLMQVPQTKAIGDALGFGSALLFSSVFGIRLLATQKLVPAGPLLGLSICALALFILAYLQDNL